ncbi:MAG: hypothetical protein IPK27_07850 [Rhodanobacteraceae bacterium]|nr:hypothetical protein [Rhodanobacteraceae bacterium]
MPLTEPGNPGNRELHTITIDLTPPDPADHGAAANSATPLSYLPVVAQTRRASKSNLGISRRHW